MATVFTMEGAFGVGLIVTQLGGTVLEGHTVVPINYNNFGITDANVLDGLEELNDAIEATSGEKIVFAMSLGAIAATHWLATYGPTSDVPADELSFVLIGNEARRYGGVLNSDLESPFLDYLGNSWDLVSQVVAPVDTPYKVTDLARQYDGFADFPQDVTNTAAVNNAILGTNHVHAHYQAERLDAETNLKFVEGNITYLLSPTRMFWQPQSRWDEIEAGYDRPFATPVPWEPDEEPTAESLNQDAWKAADAADKLATQREFYRQDWVVTLCDKFWTPIGEFGDDIIELSGVDPRNLSPSAQLKVKGESEHIDILMGCTRTLVGVIVETGGIRMPFYVDTFDWEFNQNAWVGTANLLGIYDILNFLQVWPMPLLPIQAQIPSHAVFIWGLITVLESMISECALRIQLGIWEFVNNALSLNPDVRAWFGTLLQSNGNIFEMLKTPVYVVRTNPLLDTSPLVAKTVRMESCGTVISDITKAYGVDVSVDLWLPGDDQPDVWTREIPLLALNQPTYVVTVKDRSKLEGPTKTVLDSVIRTVVDLGGSFFDEIEGVIPQVPGMSGVYEAPGLGVNFVPPWAVLVAPEPPNRGNVVACKISHHTPKGWQHIVGGRSPKWLNDMMNATFAWLIDSISILIGITGIPSNLLAGFLNNAFLAFQLIQSYSRRDAVGPYHPAIEVMHPTTSAPYNIETVFAFVNALWDSRGYVSAQAQFRDGVVYKLGKDIFKSELVSVLYHDGTKLFTDHVEMIHFRLTPSERDVMLQIGDGKAEESPLAKHQRFITGIFESLNVLTLAPQS